MRITNQTPFFETANKLFKIESSPLIAITGGGGKTSLMFTLVSALAERGRAVAATTTKIAVPGKGEGGELFVGSRAEAAEKIAMMPRRGSLTITGERHGGKLYGFTPDEVCGILRSGCADWIVVEADGSRNLPLKAYEQWEPPVPELAALQFVVVGAEAFTEPFGDEIVFRPELMEQRFRLKRGEIISVRQMAQILSDKSGYLKNSPPQARRVLLINKADLLDEEQRTLISGGLAECLAGYDAVATVSLRCKCFYDAVWLASARCAGGVKADSFPGGN